MWKRAAIVAVGVLGAWLVALVILGAVLGARQASGTAARLSEALAGAATVGDSDLALVRGHLDLAKLAVRRDDAIGKLSLDVADVRCELPPLGAALVDGTCRELRVSGVRLEASAAAVFELRHPQHAPVRARRVVIDDAVIAFAPSAFVPELGRIAVAVEHAEAGATVLRTPLSWLLSLEVLRARLELPAGIAVQLAYDHGVLSVAGSVFGSQPIALPIALPDATRASDGRGELAVLAALARDVAERVVEKRALGWLRSQL